MKRTEDTEKARNLLRNVLFQAHWLLGITAGLVLAVMGVTGATLSFEDELVRALNRGVTSVPVRAERPLSPPELLERIEARNPERRVGTISVSAIPGRAAKVGFLPEQAPTSPSGDKPSKDGRPPRIRMDIVYADPYDGRLLGAEDALVAHEALHVAEDLHRRLAAGENGSVVTGSCAIVLVFFALSGLYLRWPRRALDWRTWLVPRWRQRGRPFLISLHSVVGTWVLLAYLSSALTGLWFGFDWTRKGMERLLGVDPAARQGVPPLRDRADPLPDLRAVWAAFERETAATGWQSASFNVPPAGAISVTVNYLVAHAPHERANNKLVLDVASGAAKSREDYADKPAGGRLAASFFPLHRGSYWGVGGVVVIGLASLTMPLFAVTGWMQYLRRRRAARAMPGTKPTNDPLSAFPESPSPPAAPPPA